MRESSNIQSKDSVIRSLQDRNTKLKQQIERIQLALETQSNNSRRTPGRQNLVSSSSEDVMLRELENANKLIKVYQNQLKNMDKNNIGSVFERIQSLEKVSMEKNEEIKELKKKLYSVSKSIDGNSRKLANFMPSNDDSEFRLSKLHQEAASLKYFVQEAQSKYKQSQANSVRQSQRIKELQKNFVSLGFSEKQLLDMKLKCSRRQNLRKREKSPETREQVIEDRTIDRFNELKNELKVMGKLRATYEKQIQLLSKDVSEIGGKCQKDQKQIEEMEEKIQSLQEEINRMKEKIRPVQGRKVGAIRKSRRL